MASTPTVIIDVTGIPSVTAALEAAEVAAQIVALARGYADFGDFCVEADTLLERYDALCGVTHNPSNGHGLWT